MSNGLAKLGQPTWYIGMVLCASLAGCGDQGPDSSQASTSAIIYGTVIKAETSVPMPNINVDITVLSTSCVYPTGISAVVTTGLDGAYRAKILTPLGAFTACMRVHVADPNGGEVEYEGSMLNFMSDAGAERDSIQVDVFVP